MAENNQDGRFFHNNTRHRRKLYKSEPRPKPDAYTSPWYDKYIDEWCFYRETVEGGDDYLSRHLFMHPKERLFYFEQRLIRAVFPNHARAIVNTYTALVYKSSITREVTGAATDVLTSFWENVDMAGHGIDTFARRLYANAYTFGHAYALVTRFDPDEQAESFGAQLESGMRPVAKVVTPEDLVDWQLDATSSFEWAMVRELMPQKRSFDQPYPEPRYQYRLWTRDAWYLYTVSPVETKDKPLGEQKAGSNDSDKPQLSYQLHEQGINPLGEVPLYPVFIGQRHQSNQPVSASPLKDIAPLVRRIANLISLQDEQIYQHVFNILIVPEEVWDELDQQDFSVAGALPRPKDAEPYAYLSPDVEQIQVLEEQIQATIQSIRLLSGVGRTNEDSRVAQSGLALQHQNVDKRALVQDSAKLMKEVEHTIAMAAAKWMGLEPNEEDVKVEYRVELEPGEVEQALDEALRFKALNPVGLANVENMVQATKSHLSRYLEPDQLTEVISDLRERMAKDAGKAATQDILDALAAGAVAPTSDVVVATHSRVGVPEPTPEEAQRQAELIEARQNAEGSSPEPSTPANDEAP